MRLFKHFRRPDASAEAEFPPLTPRPPLPRRWERGPGGEGLALEDRQRAVVELHDGAGDRRGVDLADGGAGPAAVGVLLAGQELEELVAVLRPRQPLLRLGLREHLGVAVL